MTTKLVRMKVLKPFSRNLAGRIITGHPQHPDEEGRIIYVPEAAVQVLIADDEAKRWSHRDEARAEVEGEDGDHEDDDDLDSEGEGVDVADVAAASTAGTGAAETAQQARNRRTDTSGTGQGGAPKRRSAARGKKPTAAQKGGAPVGGHSTNATTNHPNTALGGDGTTNTTNEGVNAAPDADAAPVT